MSIAIRVANFNDDLSDIRNVRFSVFVDEQRVPAELELDDRDSECLHLLADCDGLAVGTARIDIDLDGKVGRLAVLKAYRCRGVGTALMDGLHRIAERHDLPFVWCNAQLSARAFYERLGYRADEEVFLEAGIEHVRMFKPL